MPNNQRQLAREYATGSARCSACSQSRLEVAAMSDPYFNAIQEQWKNIRGLYLTCGNKKPIILYDLQEKKIYAYPYKEFKAELSKKSQTSLERDYKSASTLGSMVVFVRDNRERKLVSYIMSVDTKDPSMAG
jgi:hypothetical protein